jgi:hypothetical protein
VADRLINVDEGTCNRIVVLARLDDDMEIRGVCTDDGDRVDLIALVEHDIERHCERDALIGYARVGVLALLEERGVDLEGVEVTTLVGTLGIFG